MFSIILLIILALSLCYAAWKSTFWQRNGVRATRGFPLVGNMWKFCVGKRHYGDVYADIYNSHAELPYVGIYRIFNEAAILVRSQALLKDVMIRNFHCFQDNVLWVDPQRDPIILCNPFVAKGERWRQMRSEIVPIFTPNKVKMSFPHVKTICKKLQTYVEQNMPTNCFEVKELFSKYTLDVVASAAYGLDAESFTNKNSDFTQLCEHLFQPNTYSLFQTIALLFSPALGRLTNYCYVPPDVQKWLRSIIGRILEQRLNKNSTVTSRATTATTAATTSDFIQWLIEAKQKLNEPIDAHNIVGHCSTFLLEGFETSSSLMAFALYEYAANPVVQQQVLDEIDTIMARYNGELCYEALQEMPFFEASLYETLRLYPPMFTLLKHCTKSFTLPAQNSNGKSFNVPVGMVFVIPVKAIHYDASIYPDPLKFQPERFLGDKQRMGCQFLGFGEGPRMCPGMRFGLLQSKAGLVTLLTKYSVHLAKQMQQSRLELATTTFLTAAKDGIWISFRQRKSARQ